MQIKDCKKKMKHLALLLAAALLLELFLFNIRSVQSLFYKELYYPLDQLDMDDIVKEADGLYRLLGENGSGTLYVWKLDALLQGEKLHNVYLDIELPEAEDVPWAESGLVRFSPYLRDEGHDRYDILAEHVYRPDVEDAKYLWLSPAGGVKTLTLPIQLSEGGSIRIKEITLNAKRPLQFSPIRFLTVFLLFAAVYLFRRDSWVWKEDAVSPTWRKTALALALGLCLIFPAVILNASNANLRLEKSFRPYQLLAEALSAGQLHLRQEAPQALAELSNPYDPTLRDAAGLVEDVDFLWDTAYYDGKYYCYFGVVPCVLFYLPFYLVSGSHISDVTVIMLSAVFVYAGIYLCIWAWMRRWRSSITYAYLLICTALVFLGSGMMTVMGGPDAHDVPRAVGMAFVVWGLYFWNASIASDGKIKRSLLAAGSFCMALAVGCRPNLLLYSVMAFPFFWAYRKCDENNTPAMRRKNLFALILPYVPVAVALMAYNALRFGSITDFGYDYNLTVMDYTKKNIFADRMVIGFYEFLLRLPRMGYQFPFLENGSFAQQNAFGHGSFYYTYSYGGLIPCNLILCCIPVLFGRKIGGKDALWLAGLALANMLVNIAVAGVAYHYRLDFAIPLLLAACMGVSQLYKQAGNTVAYVWLKNFVLLAVVLSYMFHVCFYWNGSLSSGNTRLYYELYYAMTI